MTLAAKPPSPPVAPLAYFARGIDGFFLPAATPGHALVRAGTPEVDWVRAFLPAEQVLEYRAADQQRDPYPTTEWLLTHTDIDRVLHQRNIAQLLLSSSCSAAMHQWSLRSGVRFLAADFQHQQRLENKIWFDRFLRRRGIRCPTGGPVKLAGKPRASLRGRLVLQVADSLGGEGTFFLDGPADLPDVVAAENLPRGSSCLLREFVAGESLGITIFVTPGLIALSAVRRQCYYPSLPHQRRQSFAGVQWLPSRDLSPRLRREIDRVLLQLGRELYALRYHGVANVDFLVDARGRVLVIECNPRMSAATPQLLARLELAGNVPIGELFLQGFRGIRRYSQRPRQMGLPDTTFAGATLDLLPPQEEMADSAGTNPLLPIRHLLPSGRYATAASTPREPFRYLAADVRPAERRGEFSLISFAAPGQQADAETTLGTILSPQPLYNARGRFNAAAQRMLTHFRYT